MHFKENFQVLLYKLYSLCEVFSICLQTKLNMNFFNCTFCQNSSYMTEVQIPKFIKVAQTLRKNQKVYSQFQLYLYWCQRMTV